MKTSICHPKVFACALAILLVTAHVAQSMAQSDEWIKLAIEKEIANSPELGGVLAAAFLYGTEEANEHN